MPKTTTTTDRTRLPDLRVGTDVHATIERDTKGNPVLVLIAPLQLDDADDE